MISENTSDNSQAQALNKADVSRSFSSIEQMLIENIADFLDKEEILIQEAIYGFKDPIIREESELHIRMAKAAMIEYIKTIENGK